MGIVITTEFKRDLRNADSYGVRFKGNEIIISFTEDEKKQKGNWIKSAKTVEYSYANIFNRTEAYFWECYPCHLIALNLILKKGDIIRFYAEENNNQYITAAGLFHDELVCHVERKGRHIIPRLALIWSCTPNNTARAIKNNR